MTSSEDDYWDNETDWQALTTQQASQPAQVTQEPTSIAVTPSVGGHHTVTEHTVSSSNVPPSSTALNDNSVDSSRDSSGSNAINENHGTPHTLDNTPRINEPPSTNPDSPIVATPASLPSSSTNRQISSYPSGSNTGQSSSSRNIVSRRNPENAKRISSILEGLNSPDDTQKESRKRSAQMSRDGGSTSHSNSPSPRKRVRPIPNFSIANTVQKHIELLRSNGVEEWADGGAKWKERELRKKTYEVMQAATKVTANAAANTIIDNDRAVTATHEC
ncbi:2945_t:CDS:2, partial [Acaulospora colombiana]